MPLTYPTTVTPDPTRGARGRSPDVAVVIVAGCRLLATSRYPRARAPTHPYLQAPVLDPPSRHLTAATHPHLLASLSPPLSLHISASSYPSIQSARRSPPLQSISKPIVYRSPYVALRLPSASPSGVLRRSSRTTAILVASNDDDDDDDDD
ncbi:hypothetical protein EYR38_005136 [Pleurotus pulmonarius]|nr:hypothetical protein EYR38_005135 [Pleurotus pulmonarius]KAF4600507.1 hypothetical protein EYR38_005136 [Pleurotus pulmonarius]